MEIQHISHLHIVKNYCYFLKEKRYFKRGTALGIERVQEVIDTNNQKVSRFVNANNITAYIMKILPYLLIFSLIN